MIIMNHHGGVGNSLFVYCLGKALAKELDTELYHGTIRNRRGKEAIDIAAVSTLFPRFADLPSDTTSRPDTVYFGHEIELENILRRGHPRDIALGQSGSGISFFQKYEEYYKPYKSLIKREWLVVKDPYSAQDPDDLVIHLRLGDVAEQDQLRRLVPLMPFEYYEYLLKKVNYRKLHLVTTDPTHPLVRKFDSYRPKIIHGYQVHDFKSIMAFNKISIPISTFSWWAAYLSNAREIYFPVFDYGLWWGLPDKPHIGAPDLRVRERRYIYYRPPDQWEPGLPPPRYRTHDIWMDRIKKYLGLPVWAGNRLKRAIRSLTNKHST